MPETQNRSLKVFLCHASQDKSLVRELYQKLSAEGWIDPWLDEEKLLPGQDWDLEIEKAVEASDAVLIFISNNSVTKEGYIQRELRFVLRIADYKPEGMVFVIPLRLDDCPMPRRLEMWQYVDYFPKGHRDWAFRRLLESLKLRAGRLGISTVNPAEVKARQEAEERARKEAEEKARKDREVRERKEAEELQRKQAEDRARKEREAKGTKVADDLVGKEESPQPKRATSFASMPIQEPSESQPGKKPARKLNFIPFIVGAAAIVVVMGGVYGVNYIIKNWPPANSPTPMEQTQDVEPTDTPTQLAIGSTWTRPVDGMVMMYVPEGEFTMGSNTYSDEEPIHTVYLGAFWIDQTEVTNQMYELCVAAEECDPPDSSSSHTRSSYYGYSDFDDYPVINVSWYDANAYCEWAGSNTYDVRLPTEAEWEKAARGENAFVFPWGNEFDGSIVNFCDKNCTIFVADNNFDDGYQDTAPVGSYPNGASPYDVLDMAGNVWEWVEDWYDVYPGGDPETSDYYGQTYRVMRGGSWYSDAYDARTADRQWTPPANSYYYIGFRCARSP